MLVASFRILLDKIIAGYPVNYQHQPIYVQPYYWNQFEYRHLNHFTPSRCFGCEYTHNQTRYNFHYPPHISSSGNGGSSPSPKAQSSTALQNSYPSGVSLQVKASKIAVDR